MCLAEQHKPAGGVGPQLLSHHFHRGNGIGYADAYLGQAGKELRLCRDALVAAQRQHESARDGVTVDGAHHRNRAAIDGVEARFNASTIRR